MHGSLSHPSAAEAWQIQPLIAKGHRVRNRSETWALSCLIPGAFLWTDMLSSLPASPPHWCQAFLEVQVGRDKVCQQPDAFILGAWDCSNVATHAQQCLWEYKSLLRGPSSACLPCFICSCPPLQLCASALCRSSLAAWCLRALAQVLSPPQRPFRPAARANTCIKAFKSLSPGTVLHVPR